MYIYIYISYLSLSLSLGASMLAQHACAHMHTTSLCLMKERQSATCLHAHAHHISLPLCLSFIICFYSSFFFLAIRSAGKFMSRVQKEWTLLRGSLPPDIYVVRDLLALLSLLALLLEDKSTNTGAEVCALH